MTTDYDNMAGGFLDAPLLPTTKDMEDIAKIVIGTGFSAIVVALAGALSRKYQATVFFIIVFALFFWLSYRRRTTGDG
jgi:hypothetical protein